jgi:hypothetical protein
MARDQVRRPVLVTWTKTGSEFPDDAYNTELSDAAYRTHHEAITYLFKLERTDCYIRTDEVRRFAGSPHSEMAVTELLKFGWWRVKGLGYEVAHHGDVIRSGIVAQQGKRTRDKKAQAAARTRAAAKSVTSAGSDVSADADRQSVKQASTWPPVREVPA